MKRVLLFGDHLESSTLKQPQKGGLFCRQSLNKVICADQWRSQ